jgi:hypothetical protein
MGIEPTRAVLLELKNKRFGALADSECDWRVNFRGMWGYARLRRDTSTREVPGSSLSVVGLQSATTGLSGSQSARHKGDVRPG